MVLGFEPTSSWADAPHADGSRELFSSSPEQLREIAEANDRDVCRSDVMIVLSHESRGRETYAEARFALTLAIPVFWVGEPILTAFRGGVRRYVGLESALAGLTRFKTEFEVGGAP